MASPSPNDIPAVTAAQLIADLAKESLNPAYFHVAKPDEENGLPVGVQVGIDKKTGRPFSLKPLLEEYRLHPERREGTAIVDTLNAFCDLVNRHKDANSVIFARASWPDPALTAVIDYHEIEEGEVGTPRFCRHRVVYPFPVTDESKAWIETNGKKREQLEFAQFLEEHAAELSAPDQAEIVEFERLFKEKFATPAQLLDLSRELEIHVGATVKRAERLQSGERVVEFSETHSGARGEKLELPGIFMVSLPAFVDGVPIRIPARLRYRASSGGIVWFYQLYRWEYWLRVQVKDDLGTAGQRTGLPTFEGAPEVKT